MTQALLGCLVTLNCITRLRSCAMTKKQYSTPKVNVGTVKKSIAAIASRWLHRNAAHRLAGSGLLGALRIQRRTVRSETSKPSIFNSPCIRGAPQVLFTATMRKMSSRNSLLTHFLPTRTRCLESHVQYNLNPARCQRITVSGWTRSKTRFHSDHTRRKRTQNNLSESLKRGFGCFRPKTASCCRSAKFSRRRFRREQKNREKRRSKSFNGRSIRSVLHVREPNWMPGLCT